ncbi:class I SAM-dependent methyltransferase [Roseovarius aestuariivivens]|uniref:class I SAM-dependent methyltransferase n=1 Tax=Roseovarius aestuariivivens TaxID=1888910 RepID=UPI00107FEE1E|nr:SAM-dependent methyltransferase [Roseovarius aestuariivivens]
MTALSDILAAQIRASGPMRMDAFMGACLMHPQYGYYMTRDPLGAGGDFITAPEISQMFGELLGLCLAQAWMDQGRPSPFALVELGPGRGTLMTDLLRAAKGVPGFHEALTLYLVEASPVLRARQAAELGEDRATWLERVDDLPDLPTFAVANEFFDALPIRQLIRADEGWRERVVGERRGALVAGLEDVKSVPALAHRLADTKDGDAVELCPTAPAVIEALGTRIATRGGTAIVIDYGDWRSLGDTLQAVRAQAPVPFLEAPGEADLTAHVDFEALARAVPEGCHHSKVTPQGIFLERLGITTRAQALAQHLSGTKLDAHVAAHRRLTAPGEMGTLFKAMALYPEGAAPPPGLDP